MDGADRHSAGTSPHVFEPEPSDLRRLVGAKVVVVAGAGYDDWMWKVLAAASGARSRAV